MNRPWVTLKLATSLDGRIATAAGESAGSRGRPPESRCTACAPSHDAVLVGINTAIRDNAELTVRLPDFTGEQPAGWCWTRTSDCP
jgi:diaminohydroxyphosphoribosylaminopyrimidine deaminase/5-amino-6-(5-phosphoribosylamino)uracil reductase